MPIIAGMKLIPFSSSIEPKVKRGWPTTTSMPTLAMISPMNRLAKLRATEDVPTNTAQVRPRLASQNAS
jgi:hypothetical protein